MGTAGFLEVARGRWFRDEGSRLSYTKGIFFTSLHSGL